MNRNELQQALKLTDREHFRINYLIPALEDEWIEMTIPELPNSRKKILNRHIPHLKHMRNYPVFDNTYINSLPHHYPIF